MADNPKLITELTSSAPQGSDSLPLGRGTTTYKSSVDTFKAYVLGGLTAASVENTTHGFNDQTNVQDSLDKIVDFAQATDDQVVINTGHLETIDLALTALNTLVNDKVDKPAALSDALFGNDGTGNAKNITLGTNLSLDGDVLNAVGGSGGGVTIYSALVAQSGGTYTTVEAAYAANSKSPLVQGNVTEVADTNLSAGDSINITVAKNSFWSLDDKKIDASAGLGEHVSINFVDSSSAFEYASTQPFSNLDATSFLSISGGMGLIKNANAVDNSAIGIAGSLTVQDARFLTANQYNCGVTTNSKTFLSNIEFIGAGINSEVAINCNGGRLSNIVFSGTYKENGNLNFIGSADPFVAENILTNTQNDVVFNVQGGASNVYNINSVGNLTLNVYSNSEINSSNADNVVLLANTENVIIKANEIGSIFFAPDISNSNISIFGQVFADFVNIYGLNINFVNCEFLSGYKTYAGSTGSIVGCSSVAGAEITDEGTFRKAGNDAVIGNNYDTTFAIIKLDNTNASPSDPYAANWDDELLCSTFNGDVAVQLPDPSGADTKAPITLKRTSEGGGTVAIKRFVGAMIDGLDADISLQANQSVTIQSDGENYIIQNGYIQYYDIEQKQDQIVAAASDSPVPLKYGRLVIIDSSAGDVTVQLENPNDDILYKGSLASIIKATPANKVIILPFAGGNIAGATQAILSNKNDKIDILSCGAAGVRVSSKIENLENIRLTNADSLYQINGWNKNIIADVTDGNITVKLDSGNYFGGKTVTVTRIDPTDTGNTLTIESFDGSELINGVDEEISVISKDSVTLYANTDDGNINAVPYLI